MAEVSHPIADAIRLQPCPQAAQFHAEDVRIQFEFTGNVGGAVPLKMHLEQLLFAGVELLTQLGHGVLIACQGSGVFVRGRQPHDQIRERVGRWTILTHLSFHATPCTGCLAPHHRYREANEVVERVEIEFVLSKPNKQTAMDRLHEVHRVQVGPQGGAKASPCDDPHIRFVATCQLREGRLVASFGLG